MPLHIAWFSPLPPVRSGIAAYTAEIVAQLPGFAIDTYSDANAHDFLWVHRRDPYDLVVYQLGNSRHHDFMWAYLASHPGLVVLHDARLHHARARQLLAAGRADDYRAEFAYDHPDAPPGAAELAVEGLGGSIYYLWPMLRVPVTTARIVAVHSPSVAASLREAYPGAAVDTIRMGVGDIPPHAGGRARVRRRLGLSDEAVVFAAFGNATPEKRLALVRSVVAGLRADGVDAWLLVVGDDGDRSQLRGDGVRACGYVADEEIGDYLACADLCVCLRWPTALETSASWLRCLAAGRPTIIADLPHLSDIPRDVALRVDLWDETTSLDAAMRRLARDRDARERLATAGRAFWAAHHTLDAMAADYDRLLRAAAARQAPRVDDLPAHFTRDYGERVHQIAGEFGLRADLI